jgi:hypothetical protein
LRSEDDATTVESAEEPVDGLVAFRTRRLDDSRLYERVIKSTFALSIERGVSGTLEVLSDILEDEFTTGWVASFKKAPQRGKALLSVQH